MIASIKLVCLLVAVIFAFIAAFMYPFVNARPYQYSALAISVFFYELKDMFP